jgi:hypothetical protein
MGATPTLANGEQLRDLLANFTRRHTPEDDILQFKTVFTYCLR